MLDNEGYRHTEYVVLIAFPRQQWLRERASTLRYAYIACRVSYRVRNRVQPHMQQQDNVRDKHSIHPRLYIKLRFR